MAHYESTVVLRQDLAPSDVEKLVHDVQNMMKDSKGTVHKKEYWGLRQLAYKIKKNKKGHYVFLGLECDATTLKEWDRQLLLSDNVIRRLHIRVDEISKEPSPILSQAVKQQRGPSRSAA